MYSFPMANRDWSRYGAINATILRPGSAFQCLFLHVWSSKIGSGSLKKVKLYWLSITVVMYITLGASTHGGSLTHRSSGAGLNHTASFSL